MKSGGREVIMSKITTNRSIRSNTSVFIGRKKRNNVARKPESLKTQERKMDSLSEVFVDAKEHYGDLSFTNTAKGHQCKFIEMIRLTDNLLDRSVELSGRLHAIRRLDSKLVFSTFRQQAFTVQECLQKVMQWASHLNSGDIVHARGVLRLHREKRLPFFTKPETCPGNARSVSGHCTLLTYYALLQSQILDLRTQAYSAAPLRSAALLKYIRQNYKVLQLNLDQASSQRSTLANKFSWPKVRN
ncbi:uncharacterized protein N7469_002232 [Penicillium citrinum]|uniref:Uncharacterized protein n=1 Tax=Penicillium citrinum TaxID=5077 RepID=A0A9W9PAW7_PENCI|nr:uncharacterized protein N7469_002232 [Penicillium citrinum]KAJ5240641.1 hypothetical protein N7469_002232 [Penicillium citrinum]